MFRNKIVDCAEDINENLFKTAFTKAIQLKNVEFEDNDERGWVCSAVIDSGVALVGRCELIYESVILFYKRFKQTYELIQSTKSEVEKSVLEKGSKNDEYK